MAIAFDSANGISNQSTSSTTLSHTATGSNLIAIIFNYAIDGDVLTGLTYDGVSILANQIAKIQRPNGNGFFYAHYYIAPPTGAKNVVATYTSNTASRNELFVATYTGAKQTGQPDASVSSSGAGVTSISQSLTTVADNSWLVMGWEYASLATDTAGSNTTIRINANTTSPGNAGGITDSNGAMTPAGSYAQNISWSGAADSEWIVVSIAPSTGTLFTKAMSDSVMNGASRTVSLARIASYSRSLAASIMNAASRFATVGKGFPRAMADSIMNAAGRFVVVSTAIHTVTHIVAAMTDSMMNARGRLTIVKGYWNGLITTFKAKYTTQGTAYASKYTKQNTDFEQKYQ